VYRTCNLTKNRTTSTEGDICNRISQLCDLCLISESVTQLQYQISYDPTTARTYRCRRSRKCKRAPGPWSSEGWEADDVHGHFSALITTHWWWWHRRQRCQRQAPDGRLLLRPHWRTNPDRDNTFEVVIDRWTTYDGDGASRCRDNTVRCGGAGGVGLTGLESLHNSSGSVTALYIGGPFLVSVVLIRLTPKIALYIGGPFLVSVVLIWLAPKILIFGVDRPYVTDTYDYWYRLY
jgi:hypothetical protein